MVYERKPRTQSTLYIDAKKIATRQVVDAEGLPFVEEQHRLALGAGAGTGAGGGLCLLAVVLVGLERFDRDAHVVVVRFVRDVADSQRPDDPPRVLMAPPGDGEEYYTGTGLLGASGCDGM